MRACVLVFVCMEGGGERVEGCLCVCIRLFVCLCVCLRVFDVCVLCLRVCHICYVECHGVCVVSVKVRNSL